MSPASTPSESPTDLPTVGETLDVITTIDNETGTYPDTIVGAKVVNINEDGYYTLWYFNSDGDVVADRNLSQERVRANLNANDGDWGLIVSEQAPERYDILTAYGRDDVTPDLDIDAIRGEIQTEIS